MTVIDWALVALYFVVLVGIGLQTMRRIEDSDDFAVAGNRIIWPVFFGSLAAAFLGGGASIGLAGQAFSDGYVYMFAFLAYSIQTVLVGWFVAPRLKRYRRAHTVGDVMAEHFGQTTRLLTGVLSVALCAGILGAQALAIGTVVEATVGIAVTPSVIVGMAVVILYSAFGGLWAVIQTDMMQFVLLGVLVPVTLMIGMHRAGGFDEVLASVPDSHLTGLGNMEVLAFLGLFVSFLLGETLVPPYAQRTFSTPDSRHARIGYVMTGVFSAMFFFITASLGLVALHLYPGIEADSALPTIVMELLPIGLVGIVVAALLAVIMSTASSYLNSTAVVLVKDIYVPFINSNISSGRRLWLERLTTVAVGVLATLFAVSVPSIVDALLYSYSLWAPTVIIPLLGAVLFNARSAIAAVSAIFFGGITMATWTWALDDPFDVPGVLVGVAANLLVFSTVTMIDRSSRGMPARTDVVGGEAS